jgi:hypothetical protein
MSTQVLKFEINSNSLFLARLDADLIKHILPSERFGYAFGFVLCQGMLGIGARNFKHAIVNADDAERAQRHARRHLDVIHVVNLEIAVLLDPVFDERIAQGMLGFAFGQIGAFDNQAVFAAFVFSHGREKKSGRRAGKVSAI